MFLQTLLLFAQEEAKKGNSEGSPFGILWMLLPIVVLFYFLMIRPQQRQQKQQREQLAALKRNDRVMTHSGIIGVVSNINDTDNEVTLRLEEGKMRVLKTAIARIITKPDQEVSGNKETETSIRK